jgi:hypothetical protein
MATEDHDFEEINYFNFKGRKFRWNKESTGPVRLSTEGLSDVLNCMPRNWVQAPMRNLEKFI